MSIGIYCTEQSGETLSVNDMINRANMAQKSIKQKGNINYAFYSEDLREQALAETKMEAYMRQALHDGEFCMYMQPKVDIQHGDIITGGEALARWQSKRDGMIFPSEFIPLFEKNGFIVELDRFMFESVCKWARNYLDEGNRPLRLATNVSRLGLFQEDFLDFYINTKNKYQIPDDMMELEFTESILLDNNEMFRKLVVGLQENGFICSLDDFGAGYSSLNILKDLPIQVLKLDMLFFREDFESERSRVVIRNVVAMAEQLQIKTVSEGVESTEQVDFLRKIGCDVVQGYVFAKPMPLAQFEQLLQGHSSTVLLPMD